MPAMNGVELQAVLAARGSRLPVIVVRGFADVPVAVRAMRQGAISLLQKPCNRAELLAAVEAALAVAQRRGMRPMKNLRPNSTSACEPSNAAASKFWKRWESAHCPNWQR
jgi:FixJ family two-component response regulator